MNDTHVPFSDLAAASKRVVQRALDIGENRLELLSVEAQEARERLMREFLLILLMAVFGLLAGITLTIGVIILFWDHSPFTAAAVLSVVYGVAAFALYRRIAQRQSDWHPFPATFDQLRKDCECLADQLR